MELGGLPPGVRVSVLLGVSSESWQRGTHRTAAVFHRVTEGATPGMRLYKQGAGEASRKRHQVTSGENVGRGSGRPRSAFQS